MTKPVVLIAEELSPATIDALGPDFEIRHCDGADRAACCRRSPTPTPCSSAPPPRWTPRRSPPADGSRSSPGPAWAWTTSTSRPPPRPASWSSTRRRPTSPRPPSSLSGCCWPRPQHRAGQRVAQGGAWKRSKFGGVELLDKTVGIVGLGRIGALVAERLKGFGMTLIAYDPYVTAHGRPARRPPRGARRAARESDFITVHLPKTPETVGLIGERALAKVKPTVRIINAARGGIVDEAALADAIQEGRVAGAGIDVFATEPCTDSPLFALEQVVVTPHLGASTDEAQEKAGVAVAQVGPPGAWRRPGARCGQRLRRGHRRGGAPRARPGGEARPDLHRGRRPGRVAAAPRRPRRDHRVRREHSGSSPRSRGCSRTSWRSRSPTSTRP